MLYNEKLPEIYSLISEADNEIEDTESFQVEQSHRNSDIGQLNSLEVAEVSKSPSSREENSFLSGVEALHMQHNE